MRSRERRFKRRAEERATEKLADPLEPNHLNVPAHIKALQRQLQNTGGRPVCLGKWWVRHRNRECDCYGATR